MTLHNSEDPNFRSFSYTPSFAYYFNFLRNTQWIYQRRELHEPRTQDLLVNENNISANEVYDVVLVGGGLFSCCLHYFLKKKNPQLKIVIIEKEKHLGGCIRSYHDKVQNSEVLFDVGPNMFKLTKDSYLLINELNLTKQLRILDSRLVRYIQYNKQLYPFNFSIWGYFRFPLISFWNKIKLIKQILFRKYKNVNSYEQDLSIQDYMIENFDIEHFKFLLLPLVYGTCGGNGNISAKSFFFRNLKLCTNKINTLQIWKNQISRTVLPDLKTPHTINQSSGVVQDLSSLRTTEEHFSSFDSITNTNYFTKYKNEYEMNSSKTRGKDEYRLFQILKKGISIVKIKILDIFHWFYERTRSEQNKEKQKIKRLLNRTVSFQYGMLEIINTLQKYISPKYIYLESQVDYIKRHNENLWKCKIIKHRKRQENVSFTIYGKQVVCTTNSKICSNLLRYELPDDIKCSLYNIPYANIICVTLCYDKKDITIPKNFFGFLSSPPFSTLMGCFYVNNIFTDRCDNSKVMLTIYMGGSDNPAYIYLNKMEIEEIVIKELQEIFNIPYHVKPKILKIQKWFDAIPLYSNNYEECVHKFLKYLKNSYYKNLFIDSSWLSGTSISDRISSAKQLAEFMY